MNSDNQVIEEDSEDYSDASENSGSSDELIGEFGENFEVAKILTEKFHLPKDLCENPEIFNEFFSLQTWINLPEESQAELMKKHLPNFPENDDFEKQLTIQKLFSDEIVRFGQAPLGLFQKNLEDGNYRPDIAHYRKSIKKAEEREHRFQECERISRLAKNLMISREKLLRNAYMTPPGSGLLRVNRFSNTLPKLSSSAATLRAKKRYFQEITEIVEEIGLSGPISDDENYPEGPPTPLTRKQKKQLTMIQGPEMKIVSTLVSSRINNFDSMITSSMLTDEHYRQLLQTHKKRKIIEPDHPELEIDDIKLKDVYARTQLSLNQKKSLSNPTATVNKKNESVKIKEEPNASSSTSSSFIVMNPLPSTSSFQQQLNRSQSLLMGLKQAEPTQQPTQNQIKSVNVQERLVKMGNEADEEDWIKANIIKVEPRTEQKKPTVFSQPPTKKRSPSTTIVMKPMKKFITDVDKMLVKSEFSNDNQNNPYAKPATLSDLDGIDMMNIPVDLDSSGNSETQSNEQKGPELMQETHACFLSLIRDIFCSTPNHRMKLEELRRKIGVWLTNPITPLNDWFGQAENWLQLLTSAIHFLSGDFLEQPEDYVPYIEYKTQLNIYQWIGAGRDSDNHLLALCQYWLSRRYEMGIKPNTTKNKSEVKMMKDRNIENSMIQQQRCASPPPPRCPTEWRVVSATDEETRLFREQERRRYEHPHLSFTYRQHGYESVVGPVKGIYTQVPGISKARDHNTLVADRPNFVTILALVRDATARLPNGEGTRADICELLKSSQYISPQATDQILQTIVSGALDRMHMEIDPCVKYDGKRKLWIYLHRNRTEEEFERLHLQQQGMAKQKKPIIRNKKMSKSGCKSDSNEDLSPNSSRNNSMISMSPISPSNQNEPLQNSQIIMAKSSFHQKLNPSALKTVPALSQIENKTKIPIVQMSPPPLINKMSPKKVVAIKQQQQQQQQPEPFDVEASLDAHTTPILVKGGQNIQKLTMKTIKDPPSPIKVNSPGNLIHRNSPTIIGNANQSILIQNRSHSPATATLIGHKKIAGGKPVIISQSQAPPLVSQSSGNTGYLNLIPIMSSADGTTKMISTSVLQGLNAPKLIKTAGNEPPALATKITQKNIVKLNTTVTGKTLINPSLISTQPKFILTNSAGVQQIQQQQQQQSSNLQSQQPTKNIIGTVGVKSGQPILSQQKQILQSILVQQQKQKSLQQNSVLIATAQGQSQSNATVQSNQQKIPALTLSSPNANIAVSSVANPATSPVIQTVNANVSGQQQQQQTLLQTIKQHQLKQHGNQQQTLIVKPQILQQHQKHSPSGEMTNAPPLVSMQSTNTPQGTIQTIAKIIKPGGSTVVQHPNQVANITVSRSPTVNANTPIVAKMLTSGAQLISLDSLLQKPGTTFKLASTKPGQTGLIQIPSNQGQQFTQYVVTSKGKNILVGGPQRFITTQANITGNSKIIDSASSSGNSNVIISSPNLSQQQQQQQVAQQTNQSQQQQQPQQQQQIKIVQSGQIQTSLTAQQLVNAKLINVQGLGNKGIKTTGGIKMMNTQNYIANIGGKSLLITGKPTTVTNSNSAGTGNNAGNQGIVLQASGTPNGTSYILGSQGQPLKVQGNIIQGNVNIINQPNTSQTQTVMLGNQLVKVQAMNQVQQQQQQKIGTQQIQIVSSNNNAVNSENQSQNDTVVLTAPGQTIKVQPNVQAGASGTAGNRPQATQQIILSSSLKNVIKNNAQGTQQQRVVLATPSGQPGQMLTQQIILPAGFQGGAINLKTLQGLKVIPIAQQGGSTDRVFARLLTTTATAPSPKQQATNPNNCNNETNLTNSNDNNNNLSNNDRSSNTNTINDNNLNQILKDDIEIMDEIEIKDESAE